MSIFFFFVVVLITGAIILTKLKTESSAQKTSHSVADNAHKQEPSISKQSSVGVRYGVNYEEKNNHNAPEKDTEMVPIFCVKNTTRTVWVCPYCGAENEMVQNTCLVCSRSNEGAIYKGVKNVL